MLSCLCLHKTYNNQIIKNHIHNYINDLYNKESYFHKFCSKTILWHFKLRSSQHNDLLGKWYYLGQNRHSLIEIIKIFIELLFVKWEFGGNYSFSRRIWHLGTNWDRVFCPIWMWENKKALRSAGKCQVWRHKNTFKKEECNEKLNKIKIRTKIC